MRTFGFTLALVAGLLLAGNAHAQISTKGAGKSSISVIKFPVVNIGQKAAGTMAAKPSASVVGKPPTGGILSSLKLAKDISDPLKPGFAPGDYVLDIETAATPDGNADSQYVAAFVTLTIDAAFKCTVHAAESVNGDAVLDQCGTAPNLCAPDAVGKCSFTIYQAAGIPNYNAVGDAQPNATRVRLRKLTNPANCKTADIDLAGVPIAHTTGTADCRNASNTVVGVVGVAAGDQTP
jgi:hypothetical protein